jgi:hypothetical protein
VQIAGAKVTVRMRRERQESPNCDVHRPIGNDRNTSMAVDRERLKWADSRCSAIGFCHPLEIKDPGGGLVIDNLSRRRFGAKV